MTPTAGSNADTPKLEDFLKGAVDLIAAGAVVEGTERLLFVADDCLAQRDISSVALMLQMIEEVVPSISKPDPAFEEGSADVADPGVAARLAYLNLLGMIHGHSGDASHAGEVFERQRRLALASDEPVYGVLADMNQGALLLRLGAVEEAEGLTRRALEGNRSIGDRFRDVQLLVNLSYTLIATGRVGAARTAAADAVEAADSLRQPMLGASSRIVLAQVLAAEGDFRTAAETLRAALTRARRAGIVDLELTCLQNLAATFLDANDYRSALRWARKAANLADALESPEAMATQHRALGQALFENSRLAEAAEEFELAHELSLDVGESNRADEDGANLGAVLVQVGETDRGVELLQQALLSFAERGDNKWQIRTLQNLAQAHVSLGEHDRSREVLSEALLLASDEETRTQLHRLIGEEALAAGDPQAANTAFRAAVDETTDAARQAWAAAEAGSLFDQEGGETSLAIHFFRQALDVYQSLGNQQMEFQVRNDLGGALARLGNYDEAQSQLRRCVELADSLQDRLMQQQAWFNTAEVSRRIGDSSAAVRESLEAARLAEELGDRDLTARAVDKLGHALIDDGQGEAALAQFERLANLPGHDEGSRLSGLAALAFLQQDYLKAAQLYEKAVKFESGRARVESVAGWLEALSFAGATRRLPRPAQILVDLSQAEHHEDVGISGLTVSGHALFRNGHEKKAAELYALAIALAGTRATELGLLTEEAIGEQLEADGGSELLTPGIPQLLHAMAAPKVHADLDGQSSLVEGRMFGLILDALDALQEGLGSDVEDLLRWSWNIDADYDESISE